MWFAEGFTSYYEPLTLQRSGLSEVDGFAGRMGYMLDLVIRSPARKYRSAEEVSRLAQFVDAAVWTDPTNTNNNYVSYYDWGAVIGLALDLSLRARTDHKVTLDDYMRRMWQEFGRATPAVEGVVARPYTMLDLRTVLADVCGDRTFADDFFDRFVQGREVVDYAPLLARAGMILRRRSPGRSWIGELSFDFSNGTPRIAMPTTGGHARVHGRPRSR